MLSSEKWEVQFGEDGAVIYAPDSGTVATIPDDLIDYKAHAHLIKVAPQLLSALEEMTKMVTELLPLSKDGCGWGMIAVENALAIIAKAKGDAS